EVCFADARWPEKNDIAGIMDEPQRSQFLDLPLVDGRLKTKIEMIEGLHKGQMCQLQPGAQISNAPGIHFTAQQLIEQVRVARLFLRGLLQQALQSRFHRFQAEPIQQGLESLDGRHRAPPIAALSYT